MIENSEPSKHKELLKTVKRKVKIGNKQRIVKKRTIEKIIMIIMIRETLNYKQSNA